MGFVITTVMVVGLILLQFVKVAAPVIALIYAYKKLPRIYFLLLALTIMAGSFWVFKDYERAFKLSVVPDALHVDSISYSEEESWGFGPGGNEAGIRMYPLSEQVANQILERGAEYFKTLSPNKNQQDRGWRGLYDGWLETPIRTSEHWKIDEKTNKYNIYDYICAYGFCIDIQPAVAEAASSIVNSPGSYYAYGRIGIIVVSPKTKQVLYMYNG
jgi:hypothetical protein